MIYFETISNLMHNISHGSAPSPLQALFLNQMKFTDAREDLQQKVTFFKKMQSWKFKSIPLLISELKSGITMHQPYEANLRQFTEKTIRKSVSNLLSVEDEYVEINKIIDFLKS